MMIYYCLVVEPYPSEKSWSSSVGMMAFPINMGEKSSEPPTSNRHINFWSNIYQHIYHWTHHIHKMLDTPTSSHSSNWSPIKTILPQIIISWFGDRSKPSLDTSGGWTSINPSCFRLHRKGFDQPNHFMASSTSPLRKSFIKSCEKICRFEMGKAPKTGDFNRTSVSYGDLVGLSTEKTADLWWFLPSTNKYRGFQRKTIGRCAIKRFTGATVLSHKPKNLGNSWIVTSISTMPIISSHVEVFVVYPPGSISGNILGLRLPDGYWRVKLMELTPRTWVTPRLRNSSAHMGT